MRNIDEDGSNLLLDSHRNINYLEILKLFLSENRTFAQVMLRDDVELNLSGSHYMRK